MVYSLVCGIPRSSLAAFIAWVKRMAEGGTLPVTKIITKYPGTFGGVGIFLLNFSKCQCTKWVVVSAKKNHDKYTILAMCQYPDT